LNKWDELYKLVELNKEKMKELELTEAIQSTKSTKKIDTYNGARQAFGTVMEIMEQMEVEYGN